MKLKNAICALTAAAMMLGTVPVCNETGIFINTAVTAEAAKLSMPAGVKATGMTEEI